MYYVRNIHASLNGLSCIMDVLDVVPTPLFSPQYVLEMYLIGLFQCIGHVLTMQYIPIHHKGTVMYYKMYCDVFTDVLGCIW